MAKTKGSVTYSNEDIAKALTKTKGAVSKAAKALGCHSLTIRTRIKEVPELAEIVEHFRDEKIDKAEDELDKAVDKGEAWAVTFTLKTIGKHRGYTEQTVLQHSVDDKLFEWLQALRENG